jgi:hypothetical protein
MTGEDHLHTGALNASLDEEYGISFQAWPSQAGHPTSTMTACMLLMANPTPRTDIVSGA